MILTISPLSWAVDTYLVDGFLEPRVLIPDLDTPEERITREVQAAIAKEKSQPIRDEQGRIHYIVDLVDEVDQGYSDKTPLDESLGAWNKPTMFGVVRAFETQYNFKATGLFSWVGKGFTAYLTPQQLQTLQQNPKVQQITEDHLLEFSASFTFVDEQSTPPVLETPDNNPVLAAEQSLTTECSPSAECFPWNIEMVGGGKPSNGSVPIFVLDRGVGYHQDLPNVTARYRSVAVGRRQNGDWPPVVGCHAHATHVAGIISAPSNGIGTIGVYSSAPVISVAASAIFPKHNTNNCIDNADLASEAAVVRSLERIKTMLFYKNRVGIVNISMNKKDQPNNFNSNGTIGEKLKFLATPTSGYLGAFIAESAGNYDKDACDHAYALPNRNTLSNDGIMVVGAVDINGQPVVLLNNINGFRNTPNAGDEPGSNYGHCVDIWAPGKEIYSTWADSPQAGNASKPYDQYTLLSGTSMAAPHVAGVAAWLAEIGNLTTPAQIEAAVRSKAYTNGAKDKNTNLPLLLAHTTGTNSTAKPTVEFAIDKKVNGHINTNSAIAFNLSYDSIGAVACDLTARVNGNIWYPPKLGFLPRYDWGSAMLQADNYEWAVTCVSAAGTTSTAQVSATVTVAPDGVLFKYNGDIQTKPELVGNTDPWPKNHALIQEIPGVPFNLGYGSKNAETCTLKRYNTTRLGGWWDPWELTEQEKEELKDMPTTYNVDGIELPRGYYYRWEVTCTDNICTGEQCPTTNFFAHVY